METHNEFELVVSEGQLPWWRVIVAAISFTVAFHVLYEDLLLFYYVGFSEKTGLIVAESLQYFGSALVGGVSFSTTKTVLIDLDNDKLISRYCFGPITRDILTVVPSVEYVSVFKNAKEQFEVNLWYKGNRHYKMYRFDSKSSAIDFATNVAKKLKIDLLDATVKGDSQWIELPHE